ncbi:hypothetical protein K438DRAFT_2075751 [Mycena galopus ATCC 62051]|nr:hypothetical protein K438DRAFT_2075751 [Mycena galopus ATCC 62051]
MDDDGPLTPSPSEPDQAHLEEELMEAVVAAKTKVDVATAALAKKKTAHEKAQLSGWPQGRKNNISKAYEDAKESHRLAVEDLGAAEKKLQDIELSPEQLPKKLDAEDAKAAAADVKVTEEAKAAAAKVAADAKVAEDAKVAADVKVAEDAKAAAAKAAAADAKVAEDAKVAAAKLVADAKVAEDAKVAADAKVAEEAKAAAAKVAAADAKVAEDAKVAADAKVAEDAKVAADAKVAEEAKVAAAKVAADAKGGSSGEDEIERSLQAIDQDPSDEEKGSKRKKPLLENDALWKQLLTNADLRLQHETLSELEATHLRKTKADAETALANWAKTTTGTNDAHEKNTASAPSQPKMIEEKWAFSFLSEAQNVSGEKYFNLKTPEEWREEVEREIWDELVKFTNTPAEKGYSMNGSNRRLLRKVPDLLPACATMSRRTTMHIFTDIDEFTHCRFHDQKRTTMQAKHVDGWTSSKYAVDGVALVALEKKKSQKRPPARPGFLDCGCDEEAALFDFLWFKTWKVRSTNPAFLVVEDMKNDVFSARHRAFFTQAYSAGTCLKIEDFFSMNPVWGTPEYDARLRLIQAERMIEQANILLNLDPKAGYVMKLQREDVRIEDDARMEEDVM